MVPNRATHHRCVGSSGKNRVMINLLLSVIIVGVLFIILFYHFWFKSVSLAKTATLFLSGNIWEIIWTFNWFIFSAYPRRLDFLKIFFVACYLSGIAQKHSFDICSVLKHNIRNLHRGLYPSIKRPPLNWIQEHWITSRISYFKLFRWLKEPVLLGTNLCAHRENSQQPMNPSTKGLTHVGLWPLVSEIQSSVHKRISMKVLG